MRVPNDRELRIDPETGRWRLVKVINPKLDASQKMRQRKSQRRKPARKGQFYQ